MQTITIQIQHASGPIPGLNVDSFFCYIDGKQVNWCHSWKAVIEWLMRINADTECQIKVRG